MKTFQDFTGALAGLCAQWYVGWDDAWGPRYRFRDDKGEIKLAEDKYDRRKAFDAELLFVPAFCVWRPLLRYFVFKDGCTGWVRDSRFSLMTDWRADANALSIAHGAIRGQVLSHDPSCFGEYRTELCKRCFAYGTRNVLRESNV